MARGLKKLQKAKTKRQHSGSSSSNKGGNKNQGSSSSSIPAASATKMGPAKVWQPGVDELEEGEELQCDLSAYNSLHAFHIGLPCLSFDILRDNLGLVRTEFPHTAYCVAGTQAEKASDNYIGIFKISNISGKRRALLPKKTADGSDMESDSSDSDDDDDDNDKVPVLQMRKVSHVGGFNRIRAMRQKPQICASWSETGHVEVWDFNTQLKALAESDAKTSNGEPSALNHAPLLKFNGHKDEGYALDWNPLVEGRLVTGDCKGFIHLWEPASGSTWNVNSQPFVGHTASVEDLQWSPTEPYIFASSSVDRDILIWDTRQGKSPVISIKEAHKADVNVISWNSLASSMLASGCDDGTFSVRDLRNLNKPEEALVAHFAYHKHPITSIEWSPHEASTLALTSSDNQLTIWDLSLERDKEEEDEFKALTNERVNAPEDLPPQLLFVHQGQKDLKELRWHSQIPGMIISTAADGFNILMPSNIETALPPANNAS